MATKLIDSLNSQMGFPIMEKEELQKDTKKQAPKSLRQTTIPFALAGIYQLAASEEGAKRILEQLLHERKSLEDLNAYDCLQLTFGNNAESIVNTPAEYTSSAKEHAKLELNEATRKAYLLILQEIINEQTKPEDITRYMVDQRHSILVHLPAELKLGHLLGDDTLDDVSNKMEGPISNLMHNLGESFSASPR
jgi:hypothetical protein